MPPRIITAAILAFWLTMTGLLIHHEVVPMMLADVSPTFQPDLTDEIGSPLVGWTVLRDGEEIGSGTSKVNAQEDGNYEFRSNFHFKKLAIGPEKHRLHVRQMENSYVVTDKGKLLTVTTRVIMNHDVEKPAFAPPDISVAIQGEVVDGKFEPNLTFNQLNIKLDKIDMPQQGNIINPMHLINRLRGLRAGQTWKITLVDPFRGLTAKLGGDFTKSMAMPALLAEVKPDTLTWDKREVQCLVIEYREAGKDITARTWVRRSDGLVLQQEASNLGFEMILQRKPNN